MLPMRPYLMRALYDWILDSHCTPYLMVSAEFPNVMIPSQFVRDGKIVLNISPGAIQQLLIDVDGVSFTASFGGLRQKVYAPIAAVMALYAMENGQGMVFEGEDSLPPVGGDDSSGGPSSGTSSGGAKKKGAHLHIVK